VVARKGVEKWQKEQPGSLHCNNQFWKLLELLELKLETVDDRRPKCDLEAWQTMGKPDSQNSRLEPPLPSICGAEITQVGSTEICKHT